MSETAKVGERIQLNALWRANRGLLAEKYAAWGDDYPATGEVGTVSANTPGSTLWVRFAGRLVDLPVHYDECELTS